MFKPQPKSGEKKEKHCNFSGGCNRPQWGGGMCSYTSHQAERVDSQYLRAQAKKKEKQKNKKPLKRTPIKWKPKPKPEPIINEAGEVEEVENEKMLHEVYDEIISEREPVSFLTGLGISGITYNNLAHVIAKSHPEFRKYCRLDKDDIVFLIQVQHDLFDAGTDEEREAYAKWHFETYHVKVDWAKLYALRDSLLLKYQAMRDAEINPLRYRKQK